MLKSVVVSRVRAYNYLLELWLRFRFAQQTMWICVLFYSASVGRMLAKRRQRK